MALLRKRRPDTVIAMDDYCGVSGNPEHIATARLLLRAIPLAASPRAYPAAGDPWRVKYVIFTAHVLQGLIDCGYCSCEGDAPPEAVEEVLSLEDSATHGMTCYRVACLVAKTCENTMMERGLAEDEIQAECGQAEAAALAAWQNGVTDYPILEPCRLRPMW